MISRPLDELRLSLGLPEFYWVDPGLCPPIVLEMPPKISTRSY